MQPAPPCGFFEWARNSPSLESPFSEEQASALSDFPSFRLSRRVATRRKELPVFSMDLGGPSQTSRSKRQNHINLPMSIADGNLPMTWPVSKQKALGRPAPTRPCTAPHGRPPRPGVRPSCWRGRFPCGGGNHCYSQLSFYH